MKIHKTIDIPFTVLDEIANTQKYNFMEIHNQHEQQAASINVLTKVTMCRPMSSCIETHSAQLWISTCISKTVGDTGKRQFQIVGCLRFSGK